MSSEEKQMSLASHRLDQAGQSMEEASYLRVGRHLNKAFELRQRGDYREYFKLT